MRRPRDSWLRLAFLAAALGASVWAIVSRSAGVSLATALLIGLVAWLLAGVAAIILLRFSTGRRARVGENSDRRLLRWLPVAGVVGVGAGAIGMDLLLRASGDADALFLSMLLPALVGAFMLAVEFGTPPSEDEGEKPN
jgi:hypothetical protein